MKRYLILLLILLDQVAVAQPNCNVYKAEKNCYEACLEAEKAIQHPQGSKESEIHFDKSIELCPSFDYSYHEKSVPYLKRGLFVEWKALMDKAVELNPKAHLGYRGWCRFQFVRDYQGAIDDIERLESIANFDIGTGSNGDYHLTIAKALCYKALNQKEKAIEIIEGKLTDKEYQARSYDYLHLGVLYIETKKYEKALSALTKQISINDYLAETYYYLGICHREAGEKQKSKEYFSKALAYYESRKYLKDPYTQPIDRIYKNDIEKKLKE